MNNENNQFLTSELFKLMDEVGLMQEQPKPKIKKECDDAAVALKAMLDSLITVGFTREEAFKFILYFATNAIKK